MVPIIQYFVIPAGTDHYRGKRISRVVPYRSRPLASECCPSVAPRPIFDRRQRLISIAYNSPYVIFEMPWVEEIKTSRDDYDSDGFSFCCWPADDSFILLIRLLGRMSVQF